MLLVIRLRITLGISIGHISRPAAAAQDVGDDLPAAMHARHPVAERDDHVPGQGGYVDDGVGPLLGGAHERVGRAPAALGVGVEHLDRGCVHRRTSSASPGRVADPETMFSAIGRRCSRAPGSPSSAIAKVACTTAAAPAMSDFHLAHASPPV